MFEENWLREVQEQHFEETSFEVGYIITYDDGRKDNFGKFPLSDRPHDQFAIFKKMAELEPSIYQASYIFGMVRLQKEHKPHSHTIEYYKSDIKQLAQHLARPGIIRKVYPGPN